MHDKQLVSSSCAPLFLFISTFCRNSLLFMTCAFDVSEICHYTISFSFSSNDLISSDFSSLTEKCSRTDLFFTVFSVSFSTIAETFSRALAWFTSYGGSHDTWRDMQEVNAVDRSFLFSPGFAAIDEKRKMYCISSLTNPFLF